MDYKEKLREIIIEKRKEKNEPSGPMINVDMRYLLELLMDHRIFLERKKEKKRLLVEIDSNIKKCFKSKNFLGFFGFHLHEQAKKKKNKDPIDDCLLGKNTIDRFIRRETKGREFKPLDFMSLYIGYAGWKAFSQIRPMTIAECFHILKDDPDFIGYDIDGYKQFSSIYQDEYPVDSKTSEEKLINYIEMIGISLEEASEIIESHRLNTYAKEQIMYSNLTSVTKKMTMKIIFGNE